MIAACGAPVSHSDRAAVYARRVPISTPATSTKVQLTAEDKQYIYDAGPDLFPVGMRSGTLMREVPGAMSNTWG